MRRRLRAARTWIILIVGALLGIALAGLNQTGRGPLALLPGRDVTWQTVESRGVWRVGMDPSFPPFETLDAAGAPAGYDVDLARSMAEIWGVEAEIVAIGYDSLLDALQTGQVDSVISALPYDPRETKDFRFSAAYFDAGVMLATDETSVIRAPEDLTGRTVAVEWGSSGDMIARRLARDGIDLTLAQYATPDEVIEGLVRDDGVDAALIDHVTLRQAQGRGEPILAAGESLESAPYVIASPIRAPQMAARIDAALEALKNDGSLAEIETRWFGPLPEEPATP
ncbi:MAG: amino acid ABC transporter substrate-binding protein [Caldilineaceae bacterium]|nr:amino acid ABC transporter substrate-binding protein [Caldilineaceae bacterium]